MKPHEVTQRMVPIRAVSCGFVDRLICGEATSGEAVPHKVFLRGRRHANQCLSNQKVKVATKYIST